MSVLFFTQFITYSNNRSFYSFNFHRNENGLYVRTYFTQQFVNHTKAQSEDDEQMLLHRVDGPTDLVTGEFPGEQCRRSDIRVVYQ